MWLKMKVGDTVLVESLAGPRVRVQLQERLWPANCGGWSGIIVRKEDVAKLIASGVPYDKGSKPVVFVFDYEIVEVVSES